ncbi:acidic leucine-rich nuclear phosphoprotein 32 family member B-like [Impatiens glandulifera]|uniref:acidic leucine-rich nuclear phosphoprotein 32 family member B-like n=1 Tax=Impatiens glandulifera TaxID=253017 RepID=UPI001FB179FE|nr:acidic leucine-rich nuclear phosphoprotein 32 family member B-like [Impatiens glandulifera]
MSPLLRSRRRRRPSSNFTEDFRSTISRNFSLCLLHQQPQLLVAPPPPSPHTTTRKEYFREKRYTTQVVNDNVDDDADDLDDDDDDDDDQLEDVVPKFNDPKNLRFRESSSRDQPPIVVIPIASAPPADEDIDAAEAEVFVESTFADMGDDDEADDEGHEESQEEDDEEEHDSTPDPSLTSNLFTISYCLN